MTLRPSNMGREQFVQSFGTLYEHSPWVAERVWDAGIDQRFDVPGFLHEQFVQAVMDSGPMAQLNLLRQHPELGMAKARLEGHSLEEQRGVGLDQCSESEFEAFQDLNRRYRERFGFPFIIAVKGLSRDAILKSFGERFDRPEQEEFDEALRQVCLIGKHRLAEAFHG